MNFNFSEEDVNEMVKKAASVQIEDRIEDVIYDVLNDDELKNAIIKVMIEYINTEEGKNLIKQSFIKNYINNGAWIEYDFVSEAIDGEIANIIKKLFKNINFNFNEKKKI